MSEKKIALIGLDTSHTVEFTKLMQHPDHRVCTGLRAVTAVRFPSPFQSEEGQDRRQADLEAMGVRLVPSIAAAVEGADAIFLELNDPADHLKIFAEVVGYGLPTFIDKPLADTVRNGSRIVELAAAAQLPVWSASSLRFMPSLEAARQAKPQPELAHAYGPLGKAAAGSDLIWYGVHTVEMVVSAMGGGAKRLRALRDGAGVTLLIEYGDGRRALAECLVGRWFYGGRLQDGQGCRHFQPDGQSSYVPLMAAMRDFVVTGRVPVPLTEALEVLAILNAGEASLARNGAVVEVGCAPQ